MRDNNREKNLAPVWLGIGLMAGFITGYKLWRQHKARQNSPLIRENESLWALVTGASSGIGAEYARKLAKNGYNLILVARRTERLDEIAEVVAEDYSVKVRVLTADLSTNEGIEQAESLIASLGTLNVLVNNAGFGSSGSFADNDMTTLDNMIQLHIVASVRLTRAVLPLMLSQKRGAIVNVSSLIAFFPISGGATYSATKSYLNAFTEALHQELSGSGVRVQALCPGLTRTEFQLVSGHTYPSVPQHFWLTPESVVDRSLRDLMNDRVISVPGFLYRLLMGSASYIPRDWVYTFGRWLATLGNQANQPFGGFRKKTWGSFDEFASDLTAVINNKQQIKSAMKLLDRDMFHRLMLVVTQVNGCRYCADFHTRSALMDGMTTVEINALLDGVVDDVPEDEHLAILYAQHWAEAGGRSDEAVRNKVVAQYGEEVTNSIEGALQMIQMGNYTGNAWDYLLYTISGGRWGNETR